MIETERGEKIRSKGRGKDTLFRVTVRNQIDQISIADNKANMIISINTIIITIIVTILGSNITFKGGPFLQMTQIMVPFTILLVACMISAVYAILAARPRILNKALSDGKGSILFFGNYKDMNLDDYLNRMEDVLNSNTSIYRNLVIDMYNYGQILSRKYKLLWLAYTFFLVGMVLCVVSYFIVMMITQPFSKLEETSFLLF
jgi:hypothetical protein